MMRLLDRLRKMVKGGSADLTPPAAGGDRSYAGLFGPKPLAKIRRLGVPAKARGAGSMNGKMNGGGTPENDERISVRSSLLERSLILGASWSIQTCLLG